jgi:hypothetical protein
METTKSPTLFALLLAALGLFSSCTHRYYAPNPVYTPLLNDSLQLNISAGVGTGDDISTTDIHVAYSPIRNGAVMVNYFNGRSDQNRDENQAGGKGFLLEGMAGAFKPLGDDGMAAIFAGYGQGNVYNRYFNSATSKLYFSKFSIQPGITYKLAFFRLGIGARLGWLHFRKGDVDVRIGGDPSLTDEFQAIKDIEAKRTFYMTEFGANAGIDIKYIYFFLNLATSTGQDFTKYHFSPTVLSVGAEVKLYNLHRHKQPRR